MSLFISVCQSRVKNLLFASTLSRHPAALEYAQALQPFRHSETFHQIADALNGTPEKADGCTIAASGPRIPAGAARFRHASLPTAGQTYYVSVSGSDANSGNETSPFATIGAALAATRLSPGSGNGIVIRAGTYYLRSTVSLTPADSGLVIQAYPGEEVWLSGAVPLTGIQWTPYNVSNNPSWVVDMNANGRIRSHHDGYELQVQQLLPHQSSTTSIDMWRSAPLSLHSCLCRGSPRTRDAQWHLFVSCVADIGIYIFIFISSVARTHRHAHHFIQL